MRIKLAESGRCETLVQRAQPGRTGQMNNQVDNQRERHNESQTGQLRRFEACHQTNENKIRRIVRIHKNSKHFFRKENRPTGRAVLDFLIRLLLACLPGRLVGLANGLIHSLKHDPKHSSKRSSTADHHHRRSFSALISSPFKMSNKANPSNLSHPHPCTIESTSLPAGPLGRCKFTFHIALNIALHIIQKLNHLLKSTSVRSFARSLDLCVPSDRPNQKHSKVNSDKPYHNLPTYGLRSNLSHRPLILMPLITLVLLCAPNVCHANESCFGGIETFEKTGMYDFNTEIKPRGTLLQQNDQALTRDCINQCKNQPICASFGLDYTRFICAAYTHSSSQTMAPNYPLRDKLQITNTTNYFEKVCYKGMSREEYQRICGLERLWAYERVLDAFLDGFEDLSIPGVANKEDCAKQCLIETNFSCRSADYDHSSKVCRLSREDRRTQPQAFRQVFGSKRDYLENQCAPPGRLCFLVVRFENHTMNK